MATYQPEDITFADRAPITAEGVGIVAGTPAEVWAALVDYPAWPTWFGNLKSCEPTSTPATGIGSTRRVVLTGGIAFDERFIAWDEGELWSFTVISGPPVFNRLVERVTITPLDERRTEVRYRMAIEPRTGFGPLIKLIRGGIEKNLTKAMRNLNGEVASRRSAPAT